MMHEVHVAAFKTTDCHVESDDIRYAGLVPNYTVLHHRRQHSTAASHYHFIMNSDDRRQLFPTGGSQTHGGYRVIPSSLQSYSNSPKNSHTFAKSLAAPAKA